MYKKAIEIDKKALPENHPSQAIHLHNLANLYFFQKRYKQAEPLYKDAIEIVKIALPENHPNLANHLHKLAYFYSCQERYKEAEPLFIKSLEILCNSVGFSHPNTQKVQKNFDNFIKQVVSESREKELSTHPRVQNLIRKIKNK